ncbi:Retron-type reverse transcriptase [uncultured Sporomusa sp.]|uniref:RNA-directed DNA polymerase n=1 Tax=uncultured Sporomusa sp. TaxID=307249 RepID=A0A212LYD8_9FIRM|nr:reverse transcriptase family protein [uncultured Sporomusa sp.]SCM82604.1 Retron-type reverse transcriptase [uncultured Sporomusa sp.]
MKIFSLDYFENRVLKEKIETLIIDPVEKDSCYTQIAVKKRAGGIRTLSCIHLYSRVYHSQKRLKENYFDKIPTSDFCYGYKKGLSYKDFLAPHVDSKYFLRIDLKDFFGSITCNLLSEVLTSYISCLPVNNTTLLDLIIDIVTLDGKLPQGAITSPTLSNIAFRQLDIRIYKYCEKYQVIYSRYADDLLFSSNNMVIHKLFFLKRISNILNSKGFSINRDKIVKATEQISLNGFIVGSELRISRKKRRLLSVILYCFDKYKPRTYNILLNHVNAELGAKPIKTTEYLNNFLSGYRSFLIGWLPYDSLGCLPSEAFLSEFDKKNLRLINQIEYILKKFNP